MLLDQVTLLPKPFTGSLFVFFFFLQGVRIQISRSSRVFLFKKKKKNLFNIYLAVLAWEIFNLHFGIWDLLNDAFKLSVAACRI